MLPRKGSAPESSAAFPGGLLKKRDYKKMKLNTSQGNGFKHKTLFFPTSLY